MQRLKAPAMALGLAGLITLLLPIYAIQLVVSRLRTRSKRPDPIAIPRVDLATTTLDAIIDAGTPVIIAGLTDALDLDTVPDVAGLGQLAEQHAEPFTVKSHRDHSPFFLYRGDYGAELDGVREMRGTEFTSFMFDAEQPSGTCTYRLFNVRDLGGRIGSVIDDIASKLASHTDIPPDREASGIWVGSAGVVTPLHHDAWTGLLFQFHGAKRILMFSPADRGNLYFSSPFSPRDVWSKLPARSGEADEATFPRYRRATRLEAQLEAGEVLFIPPFWSHEIEALEANISIPFRFKAGRREQLDPGFVLPAYEVFHQKFLHERSAAR